MTMSIVRNVLCGLLLLLTPIYGLARDTTSVSGKTAIDIFHDPKVVALIDAVVDGNAVKAKALMATGASINASGDAGVTPLIWMIYAHNEKAISLLLDLGANPNQAWEQGENPVYMAASAGNNELLNKLLDHGGDPNSPAHGNSAMMIAMMQLHLDSAELLLKRGADINWHAGINSSFIAADMVGRYDWMVWLLDHGYTYALIRMRRGVSRGQPVSDQVIWKTRVLNLLDKRISEQAGAK